MIPSGTPMKTNTRQAMGMENFLWTSTMNWLISLRSFSSRRSYLSIRYILSFSWRFTSA